MAFPRLSYLKVVKVIITSILTSESIKFECCNIKVFKDEKYLTCVSLTREYVLWHDYFQLFYIILRLWDT